jgi:ppGpp synthetase/RelA/SpoT-type nucleotidyltranferase
MEPAVLAAAYDTLRPTLDKLATYAETRLRAELDPGPTVAITKRVKDREGVLQKLQTGRFPSFRTLEDLAGVKVVVLRRLDIPPAIAAIRAAFQVVREKDRVTEPNRFLYREPHLIVLPPQDYLDRNADLAGLLTEIQVTTALQHALDQITHGFDYKPSTLGWGKRRLVAQLRASLELLDNLLDDMEQSAGIIHEEAAIPDQLKQEQEVLAAFTAVFADAELQPDRRRLSEIGAAYAACAGISPRDIPALLARHADLRGARSLTPLDMLLGALLRERGANLVGAFDGRFVVSEELESLCTEVVLIGGTRRVDLS